MIPLTARLHFHLLSSCEERKRKQKVASVREREAKENLSTLYLGRRHSFKKKNGDKAQGSLSHSSKNSSYKKFLRRKEKERRRVLGTTLGQACSRGYRERKVRSKIGWLAGSRDSHHVSRFAAFFILARAEISVDGSCFGVSRFALFFFLLYCTTSFPFLRKKKKSTI